MAPHLLTMPREIRNHIYEHIHHKVKIVVYEKLLLYRIRVQQAPYVGLFLTHSRLRDEYTESKVFTNLSASFEWIDGFCPTLNYHHLEDKRLAPMLIRLRHINVSVASTVNSSLAWSEFESLCSTLRDKSPCLVTIRTALRRGRKKYSEESIRAWEDAFTIGVPGPLPRNEFHSVTNDASELSAAPDTVAGFRHAQTCTGWIIDAYKIPGYSTLGKARRSNPLSEGIHRVRKIALSLYVRESACRRYWMPDKYFIHSDPRSYREELYACFTSEDEARIRARLGKVLGWVETRTEY